MTFLAVVAWRFVDRPLSALAVALAASLRPTMAIFVVWWLVRRQWRPIAWTVIAGLALVLITLPFVGIAGWNDYLTLLQPGQLRGGFRNFALGALASRAGARVVLQAALFVGYAVAGVAVALSARDRDVSFVVTLGATLLLSPLLWDHYMTNLLVAGGFLASRGTMGTGAAAAVLAAAGAAGVRRPGRHDPALRRARPRPADDDAA